MSPTSSRISRLQPVAALLVLAAAGGLGGCASIPAEVADLGDRSSIPELDATPFYPQQEFQCGPAALTTLLDASGVSISLATVTQLTYVPGRKGSLQTELLATARRYDRVPYVIDSTMSGIADQLIDGRAVLVLQNLGVSWYPRWHYAVVIGIDTRSADVILRSGTDRRRVMKLKTFLRTWERGNYWGVVVLEPGALPADPNRERYLGAVADLEATGRYRAALAAWEAALRAWPDNPVALFGKATAAFQLGDLATAEQAYLDLLQAKPDMYAARNNLAYVLADQGRYGEALAEIQQVLQAVSPADPLHAEYESSLDEIRARAAATN